MNGIDLGHTCIQKKILRVHIDGACFYVANFDAELNEMGYRDFPKLVKDYKESDLGWVDPEGVLTALADTIQSYLPNCTVSVYVDIAYVETIVRIVNLDESKIAGAFEKAKQ